MISGDPFRLAGHGKITEFSFAPIETAPVQSGKSFGPCLVGPGSDADWVIGHWDGQGWYCDKGASVSPMIWAPLPLIREIMAAIPPVTLAGTIAILEELGRDEDQSHPEAIRNVLVFLRKLGERHADA